MANPNARGTIGNKGGGRKSRKDEELREFVVQKALGKYLKALTRLGDGKKSGMSDKEFQRIKDMCLPVVTKDMATKLADNEGNKLEVTPIYGGVSKHDSDKKDIQTEAKD